MKILYLNATELIDKNPGCQATSVSLQNILKGEIIFKLPLGFGYHNFNTKRRLFENKSDYFERISNLICNNKDYRYMFKIVDVVVINAEGTIHSDSIGAKTLLSFTKLACLMKKKVYIVNGSFYNLSSYLLNYLNKASKIYVREVESFLYLKQRNLESNLVFDCAFLAKMKNQKNPSRVNYKKCLYTPGTLLFYKYKSDYRRILKNHFEDIQNKGFEPVFLISEKVEYLFKDYWESLGGECIDLTSKTTNEIMLLLSEFKYMISGRYHILLFGIIQNLNLITISSNTAKINGLLKNFNINSLNITNKIEDRLNIDNFLSVPIDLKKTKGLIESNYKILFD